MIYYSPHRTAHRQWRGPLRICRTTVAVQLLLLLTVSLVVCGLLEMSNMGTSLLSSSGQRVMDVHDDLQSGGGEADSHDDDKDAEKPQPTKYTYTYKTLPGYFLQDDPSTDASTFNFMTTNFGLIDRGYESDGSLPSEGRDMSPWQRFEHHISALNRQAREEAEDKRTTAKRHGPVLPHTRYVLFFLGRHGNGYHNIAERYYGSIAWDCHFSALDGDPDGVMTWADAHLSEEGLRQAREVNAFWKNQTASSGAGGQNMSLPEVYFVSPLDRTLETAEITFDGLGRHNGKLEAIVMEKIREGTGIHTCDRRSNVADIKDHFPSYNVDLDPNLTEEDEFWLADRREPDSALTRRLRSFFDDLFSNDRILGAEKERLSITSHSGAIGAMLRVLGHRRFSLGTGAVIPVFVKVDRISVDEDDEDGDDDKRLRKRHGGGGEGANHDDPTLDLPDLSESTSAQTNPNDKSHWPTIPACPADLDLDTVGQKRWGMSLKEFLDGVERGTVDLEEVAFRSTG